MLVAVILSSLSQFSAVLALLQMSMNDGMRGMGTGMMVACGLFGLLLFVALLEFVILEFLWIRVWSQRLRNERYTAPATGGRAA
jgi:uncharacterized membrane protein